MLELINMNTSGIIKLDFILPEVLYVYRGVICI